MKTTYTQADARRALATRTGGEIRDAMKRLFGALDRYFAEELETEPGRRRAVAVVLEQIADATGALAVDADPARVGGVEARALDAIAEDLLDEWTRAVAAGLDAGQDMDEREQRDRAPLADDAGDRDDEEERA